MAIRAPDGANKQTMTLAHLLQNPEKLAGSVWPSLSSSRFSCIFIWNQCSYNFSPTNGNNFLCQIFSLQSFPSLLSVPANLKPTAINNEQAKVKMAEILTHKRAAEKSQQKTEMIKVYFWSKTWYDLWNNLVSKICKPVWGWNKQLTIYSTSFTS